MKLSDELKMWGYHVSISEKGKEQHLKMSGKAAKLEAENAALKRETEALQETIKAKTRCPHCARNIFLTDEGRRMMAQQDALLTADEK